MLKSNTRWINKNFDYTVVEMLQKECHLSELTAKLLVNRGLKEVEEVLHFLESDQQQFYDPFLLKGMDKAVKRIEAAIENNEKILVYGDYDADGVSSTVVLMKALQEKGANCDYYIPNRFTEGYGPNEEAFRKAAEEGYQLIITVDNGISGHHEAVVAKEIGVDLIITDHHELSEEIPDAYCVIHPRKPNSKYPFGELAGVGVAFKVAHALLGRLPKELLDIAIIGTVADLVPLKDENRLITKLGLQVLKSTQNVGLQKLLKLCGFDKRPITEDTIGFALGPRINAVGRLGDADPAVELLLTSDEEKAEELTNYIDSLNRERQSLVHQISEDAIQEVENNVNLEEEHVLIVAKEGWNPGVIGIVASRLVEKFYRPTIVLSIDREKGVAKGSARSIAGFDLYANLSMCKDILPAFGGHPMAAGMTLRIEDVPDLRLRLNELAKQKLSEEDLIPLTEIDAICNIEDISIELVEEIERLAPFGVGNPRPKLLIENATISQMRKIGADENHLKVICEQNNNQLDCIGFGKGALYHHISSISQLSLVGDLSINEWNGHRKPQFMIHDAAVNHWQLFDFRGKTNVDDVLNQAIEENSLIVAFRQGTLRYLKKWEDSITYIESNVEITNIKAYSSIVLLDLPVNRVHLLDMIRLINPNRIYSIFLHDEEHYFNTIPTREHFKWFYGFLLKQGKLDLKKHAHFLAKKKGWKEDAIHFMAKVFFELEFVKIEKDIVTIVEKPTKKDITSSKIYKLKQEQLTLENELIYSSYLSLRNWFDEIKNGSQIAEEAMK